MDLWTFIVVIVALALSFALAETWIKRRTKFGNAADLENRIAALEANENDQLQERVATLERIVTDKKSTLKETIDTL